MEEWIKKNTVKTNEGYYLLKQDNYSIEYIYKEIQKIYYKLNKPLKVV